MLKDLLGNYQIVLGSGSPRRQALLRAMDIPFTVVPAETDENYPPDLPVLKISLWLAKKKAQALQDKMQDNWILITADTIVALEDEILGKPRDKEQAKEFLRLLSGRKHLVITGINIKTAEIEKSLICRTPVWFKNLTEDEINYYVETYKPLDKAGAYGIQEWIGYIGIKKIEGEYNNVVGLPTQKLYVVLTKLLEKLRDEG